MVGNFLNILHKATRVENQMLLPGIFCVHQVNSAHKI